MPELNKTPTICLNMIVKNESKIITRLFDSVLSIIDCYCICDTGSTDNTIEIIEQYFLEKNIPGKIVIKPFINFAYNRSFSLSEANGMSDYVLLLDADMILKINNFKKDMLGSFDSYSILQGNNNLKYPNKRIVRNNGLFKYVGVTHEYIDCVIHHNTSSIYEKDLYISDIGDGGAKSDKFERDIRLLTKGIEDEPENVNRYTFYLANSYRDYNNPEKAIEYYKKVLTLNNWAQEKYVSCLSIYRQNEILNKKEEGIYYLIESYKYDKERVECIYNLIVHYCINGLAEVAMSFYNLIRKSFENNSINFNSKLFNEPMIYGFYLPYYMIIVADKVSDRATGIKMYEILFKTKPLFFNLWWIKNLFFNLKFFVKHIPEDLKEHMNILSKDYVNFLLDKNVDLSEVDLSNIIFEQTDEQTDEQCNIIKTIKFPKTIYFCYKTLDKMKENSDKWKNMNPDFEIKLYDNDMCENFLLNEYGEIYRDIYIFLKDGPIKADFWRICILYKFGGVYSDIDNIPLLSINTFIEDNVDFVTCSSYWDAENLNFNPNFIISDKQNIILKNVIEWYVNNYKNNKPYDYWRWSIMRAFTDTLHLNNYSKKDGVYYLNDMKIQIIKECRGVNHYDAHNVYKKKRIFNNRCDNWDCVTHSFK